MFEVTSTSAHFFTYNSTAAGLDNVMQFPVWNCQWSTGNQNAFCSFFEYRNAISNAFLQFVSQIIAHLSAAFWIIEECDLHHQQGVFTGDWQFCCFSCFVNASQSAAFFVDGVNCFVECFYGDFVAGYFFYNCSEFFDLIGPFQDIFVAFHLWQVHDVHWNILSEDFPCFLFTVTGGFTNIHVSNAEEWAGSVQTRTNRCFDQWAGAFWKNFFAAWYPELRTAAETGNNTVCCNYYFIRNINTESTEDFLTVFLCFDQFRWTDTVDFGNNKVPEAHTFRTVFLREVNITESSWQHLTKCVMSFQIHVQVFPHFNIIGHKKVPPLLYLGVEFSPI